MQHVPSPDAPFTILIPWDGNIPIDTLLALAGTIGHPESHLLVLPLAPGGDDGGEMRGAPTSPVTLAWPRVEWLEPVQVAAAPEIVATAADRNVSLILIATTCQPRGTIDSSCLAAQLALHSPVPVMVVHLDDDRSAEFPPAISRLLIPLDGSARASQALPVAAALARRLGVPATLVMVIDPARALPPAYAYDRDANEEMIARLRGEAHEALTQAEHCLTESCVTVTSELLYGSATACIEAAVQPGDLLVMTTHGPGGAMTGQLGSVAARLVADNPAPLVIMRGSPPDAIVVSGHGEYRAYESFMRPAP